jgi:hypothetical protein
MNKHRGESRTDFELMQVVLWKPPTTVSLPTSTILGLIGLLASARMFALFSVLGSVRQCIGAHRPDPTLLSFFILADPKSAFN